MLLPIRTSIHPSRTPYANYVLIIINILLFIITYSRRHVYIGQGIVFSEPLRIWAEQFMLHPVNAYLWQFVTYAFLHASLMHIFGNMYFLYIFGNNVNDRLGNIGYVCLYLAGAVFAGIGHVIMNHSNPVLGASGAVAAVTGAYLVLFPRTLITIIYWFFLIGTIDLPALYFIAFKLIFWDNVFEPGFSGNDGVAYDAHLAGYAFGAVASILLLAFGFLKRTEIDLWFMLKQWNRRRVFRDTVADGYDPYSGKVRKRVQSREKKTPEQIQAEEKIVKFRSEIVSLIGQRNTAAACDKYLEMLQVDPDCVLPRQSQLDMANQLMSIDKFEESAQAYHAFLTHYPTYDHAEQIHLMLGILYSRYLNKPEKAIEHLQIAQEKLTDPGQIRMCTGELDKLKNQ